MSQLVEKYKKLGREWMQGADIEAFQFGQSFPEIKLNKKQIKFLNDKSRYVLFSGGYGSGKSLPLYVKMIFLCLFFPGNRVLLGRKTLSDIERAMLPDLFDLMPQSWYKYRIKDGVIRFFNGSEVILFGLDAMQSGSGADIKKAIQKIRSLNLGAFFIDQLEEVEFSVFDHLKARLRRANVPIRQGNMTTNPANFWAYDYFIANKKKGSSLIQSSMLDNRENLPEDYIEDQLNHDEDYVRRYVYGDWSLDLLMDNQVFSADFIKRLETHKDKPKNVEEDCEIYEEPDRKLIYQIGVDPSEGSIDPASISVISSKGEKVAKYNGFTTIPALIEKVKFLYYKYNPRKIVPESNASGVALLEGIKHLKIHERETYNQRTRKKTKKLGFYTSYQTKQLLISNFQDLLRRNQVIIHDDKTLNELKTFVWSDSAKQRGAGAQKGYHDDDVLSTLLAFWDFTPDKADKIKAKRSIPRRKKRFQYL